MKNQTFYTKTLTKFASTGSFEWKDVVAAVKGTKYEPKNWMTVRGTL